MAIGARPRIFRTTDLSVSDSGDAAMFSQHSPTLRRASDIIGGILICTRGGVAYAERNEEGLHVELVTERLT